MEAVLDLVAERGYDALTIEAVASRAGAGRATVYRRWASKAQMVMDALACLHPVAAPPDTGSLSGDLGQLCAFMTDAPGHRAIAVTRGVAARMSCDPELMAAFEERFVAPRRAVMAEMLRRAAERGEIAPGRDIDLLTSLIPALFLHRLLTTNRPPDPRFAGRIVSEVLIPAATAGAPTRSPTTGNSRTTGKKHHDEHR